MRVRAGCRASWLLLVGAWTLVMAYVASALIGCQSEERIVRYRPMLATVPGATFGTEPVGPRFKGEYVDPTGTKTPEGMLANAEGEEEPPESELVIELPDGTKRLVSTTGRHLMSHIINTIDADDREMFLDQVLSDLTKEEFLERGMDPGLAFDELKKRRADIMKLFNKMPMGEFTPGMLMKNVGGGVQRLQVFGAAASELRWTFMDMRFEHGQWKLRWFGTG